MASRQRREDLPPSISTIPRLEQNTVAVPNNVWRSLISWDDLEHWRQDNHWIQGSYRKTANSCLRCFASIFQIHNETVNIWSHLIPALFTLPVAYILHSALKPRYAHASNSDLVAFGFFFAGSMLCLGMSATYHTISNHSPLVNRIGNKLDYVGIVMLIVGSFIPSIYFGYWCDPVLQQVYWTMIVSLGIVCITISVMEKFRTPLWRPFRASMFVALGLSAVFPILHGLHLYGTAQMQKQIGLSWVVLQGALYICGAGIYAARVPEKWHPGQYDVIGSSHQIFHLFVVAAAASHLFGLLEAFDYRHTVMGGLCV